MGRRAVKRHHWWDGHMGMARRDIFIYQDDPTWRVEARERGSEGTSRWWDTPDEDSAVLLAHDLMQGEDPWRDLSSLIGAVSPIHRHDPPTDDPDGRPGR